MPPFLNAMSWLSSGTRPDQEIVCLLSVKHRAIGGKHDFSMHGYGLGGITIIRSCNFGEQEDALWVSKV